MGKKALLKFIAALLAALLLCSCSKQAGEGGYYVSGDGRLEPAPSFSSESEKSAPPEKEPASAGSLPEPEPKKDDKRIENVRRLMDGDSEALAKELCDIFYKYNTVGGSVAVFCEDEVVYRFDYGVADKERGRPVSRETVFRAASVSKAVTALLCVMEMEKGALSEDTDVSALINPRLKNPYFPDEPVTLGQLLTHTSGFYDGGPYKKAINEGGNFPSLDCLLGDVSALTCGEPGKEWVYTNFGMGLAAGAVEAVTGKRFSDYAEEALLGPMGLNAGFMPDYIDDPAGIANIYMQGELRVDPREWLGMANAYRKIPIGQMYLLGQGELYISSEDLARVASLLAGNGTYMGRRFVSERSLEDMHALRCEGQQGNYEIKQALGVRRYDGLVEGKTLYGHEGQAYGMASGVFYQRGKPGGVAVLTNGCSLQREPDGIKSINSETVRLLWRYIGEE